MNRSCCFTIFTIAMLYPWSPIFADQKLPTLEVPATGVTAGMLVTGIGLAILLALLVLYGVAPLMLYFIHARLGETNELLRHIATALQPPLPSYQIHAPPAPSGPVLETAAPTFRMLR